MTDVVITVILCAIPSLYVAYSIGEMVGYVRAYKKATEQLKEAFKR